MLENEAIAVAPEPRIRPRQRSGMSSAETVYRQLKREIVTLVLKPGAVLGEQMLAGRYGVSRTPVREAIIRLSEERLVDVRPQQGTFVSRLDIEMLPEAVVIRQALEGATTTRAARIANAADIAMLDEILAEQRFHRDRDSIERFMASDEAFHEAIAVVAQLPGIWTYLKPAKVHIDRARWLTVPALGKLGHLIVEHESIRNAIAAHDEQVALDAMTAHLQAVFPDIASLRSQYSDYFV